MSYRTLATSQRTLTSGLARHQEQELGRIIDTVNGVGETVSLESEGLFCF